MKIFAAFGGWALDEGFSQAADTGDMKDLAQDFVDVVNKPGFEL